MASMMMILAVLLARPLILGQAAPGCFGAGHSRVTSFLLSSLKDVTEQRYNAALAHLHNDRALGDRWITLDDRQKDSLVADWMVEAFEAEEFRAEYGIVLSALSRVEPQVSFKLSWKVLLIM